MLPLRNPPLPLPDLLAPLTYYLDTCYLYFGGQGVSRPHPPSLRGDPTKPRHRATVEAWLNESESWHRALDQFIDNSRGYAVGKPGFFSRYAAGLTADWAAYCFADTPDFPEAAFGAVSTPERRLFNHPEDLPPEICLSLRGIDNGYWDLFLRDAWSYHLILDSCQKRNITTFDVTP